jgi:hypothetical protein
MVSSGLTHPPTARRKTPGWSVYPLEGSKSRAGVLSSREYAVKHDGGPGQIAVTGQRVTDRTLCAWAARTISTSPTTYIREWASRYTRRLSKHNSP